ncbi:lrr receptor-like serine/threonine-protein kinase hsl2, partial [Quercus suber]
GMGGTDVSKGKQKKRKENLELKMKEKTNNHHLAMLFKDFINNNLITCSEFSFMGTISTDLCGMKNLGQLVLSRNMLFGSIPSCLGNMPLLRYLSLDSNKLSSMIPSTMWSLENLLDLNLSSNSLIGNLLPEFGTFKAMINQHNKKKIIIFFCGEFYSVLWH